MRGNMRILMGSRNEAIRNSRWSGEMSRKNGTSLLCAKVSPSEIPENALSSIRNTLSDF